MDTAVEVEDQPFDAESVGDSEDADLVPIQSGEDWVAQLDDDLSGPATRTGEAFRISALQLEDATCITLLEWIRAASFPPWKEVKGLCPEVRLLWHHRNNLSVDANGVIWRKRVTFAVAGTKTGQRVTVSGVSRFVVWRSFGTEPHTSPVELPVLLVGNV